MSEQVEWLCEKHVRKGRALIPCAACERERIRAKLSARLGEAEARAHKYWGLTQQAIGALSPLIALARWMDGELEQEFGTGGDYCEDEEITTAAAVLAELTGEGAE